MDFYVQKNWTTCRALHGYVWEVGRFFWFFGISEIDFLCARYIPLYSIKFCIRWRFRCLFAMDFYVQKNSKTCRAIHGHVWQMEFFFRIFWGLSKPILSIRGMYLRRALSCASDHVFDVLLQRTFIFKTIGKPVVQYMGMFEKWNFFSDFSGFSKSILSIRGMYPRRALNCASDHVFDVFLQWIFK